MQTRDVTLSLILTVVTCGLYGLYWMAKITNEVHEFSGSPRTAGGGKVVLFTLFTCGLYFFYWVYQLGGELIEARLAKGLPPDSVSNNVYLVAVIISTLLMTIFSVLNVFSDLTGETGPDALSTEEALLATVFAAFFILMANIAVALIITWFIYKRNNPSPRVLYIMFALFRTNIITVAFLQASLNNAILTQQRRPAVSLMKN